MTQTAVRPVLAYVVPTVLVVLGVLDLAVALMLRPSDQTISSMLTTMSIVIIACAGALQLTCAALITMRRWLGRTLYLYGIPATLVLGGAVSYLQVAAQAPTSEAAKSDMLIVGAGLLLSVSIYAVLAYSLTRPMLSGWLATASAAPAAPAPPPRHTLFASLLLRLALFAALLAVMVLVLDAPIALLYIGIGVIALMIALRYLLMQRLAKTGHNGGKRA